MEAKLKEYRALKRRKEIINKTKQKLEETKDKVFDFLTPKIFKDMTKEQEEEVLLLEDDEHNEGTGKHLIMEEPLEELPDSEEEPIIEESWKHFTIKWLIIFIIWLGLYAVFLKLQFGAVYFGISLLIGICLNTRTRPKRRGEVSAYSVFNKDCKSIHGTVTAEDLQKQMLYGGRLF